MKFALVLLLLALVVIPDSEGWGRFRFRVRLPRIRIRRVFREIIRPVKKVLKPVVNKVIRPVVKKVIRPVIKKLEEEVVKPAVDKVVKPVLQTGVAIAVATNPLLQKIQTKVCESLEEGQRDLSGMSPRLPIEDQLQDAGESLEERGVHGDDFTVRDEGDVEDELEKYLQEGRGLEGLKSLVRDERDVREIHKLLADPVRSKRLGKLVGEVLCGPARAPEEQRSPEDVDEEVTVPVTKLQYVTGPPVTEIQYATGPPVTIIQYVTKPPKQAKTSA